MYSIKIIPKLVNKLIYTPSNRPDFGEILVALKDVENDVGRSEDVRKNEPEARHDPVLNHEEIQNKNGKDPVTYLQAILSRSLNLSSSEKIVSTKVTRKLFSLCYVALVQDGPESNIS